ncbi:glutamate ligase [Natronoflexus pectinivorans]|uniref:Glutamate--cysteine ligase n=1 Tax=Natronoflexus pectinivorans TaxID=682526 RepID=A0A4R2G5L9_9BACT|nr:glutamate ligase [Natronoflexus pectinivorans]TCO03017.1 glutamate--cysteine ligase [Natronoflexus pectinivorans]
MQDVNYMFVPLKGYEQFEATTQIIIAEIIKRELPFEIIDEHNNLISVNYNNREFIIHEGTISDANSLIAYWISNDKWMTKQFLKRAGISCAQGAVLKKDYSVNDLSGLQFPVVVKPANTDHGIAVSTNLKSMEDAESAIELAFGYSDRVIVEEFFTGREYRFLVVDDAVRAIAYREPANVTGDGVSTIAQLIEVKNSGRGEDYTHPLLKIKSDREVLRHLSEQSLTLNDVLEEGRKVYLRENSNLSTGGDSIDVTDEMPQFYMEVAVNAARSAGLRLAGIDIIIDDIKGNPSAKSYIVVELNAPAMLSMHNYPYKGKNRHVEKYVLDCILSGK